jgi:hypothetical protein
MVPIRAMRQCIAHMQCSMCSCNKVGFFCLSSDGCNTRGHTPVLHVCTDRIMQHQSASHCIRCQRTSSTPCPSRPTAIHATPHRHSHASLRCPGVSWLRTAQGHRAAQRTSSVQRSLCGAAPTRQENTSRTTTKRGLSRERATRTALPQGSLGRPFSSRRATRAIRCRCSIQFVCLFGWLVVCLHLWKRSSFLCVPFFAVDDCGRARAFVSALATLDLQ